MIIRSKNDIQRYVNRVFDRLNVVSVDDATADQMKRELFVLTWRQHMDNLRGSLGSTPVLGENWSEYLESFDWNELILEAEENLTGCEAS